MNGILVIDKEKGYTSRDVVNQLSHILGVKKIGHTGTLDPLATGVLVCAIGKYTKLVESLTSLEKEYIAVMQLGVQTDTEDCTGNVLKTEEVLVREEKIRKCFKEFPKNYLQKVPKYSAVKIKGKKLYEYAREGSEIELPSRQVHIYALEILKIEGSNITFKAKVSKGTYIRSLITDLAQNMNCIATMKELRRISQGDFKIQKSYSLEEIKTGQYRLLQLEDIFSAPKYEITEEEYKRVQNGNLLNIESTSLKVFLTYHENVIACYEKEEKGYRPLLVL